MSVFVTGVAVACAYVLFRFIEMRFILKENKPVKCRKWYILYTSRNNKRYSWGF